MDDPRQYKTYRVKPDLSLKLAEVLEVLGESSPDYLDPLIRQQIENDHKANAKAIKAMRDAREAREKAARKLEGVELGESGA